MAAHQGLAPVRRGAAAAALRAAEASARAAAAAARAMGLIDVAATAVAAALALSAAAVLALPADLETEMRLEAIQSVVQEEVAAGATGRAPQLSGKARAARNVAVHWRPGSGPGSLFSALQRPQGAQRGQRKGGLSTASDESTKDDGSDELFPGSACPPNIIPIAAKRVPVVLPILHGTEADGDRCHRHVETEPSDDSLVAHARIDARRLSSALAQRQGKLGGITSRVAKEPAQQDSVGIDLDEQAASLGVDLALLFQGADFHCPFDSTLQVRQDVPSLFHDLLAVPSDVSLTKEKVNVHEGDLDVSGVSPLHEIHQFFIGDAACDVGCQTEPINGITVSDFQQEVTETMFENRPRDELVVVHGISVSTVKALHLGDIVPNFDAETTRGPFTFMSGKRLHGPSSYAILLSIHRVAPRSSDVIHASSQSCRASASGWRRSRWTLPRPSLSFPSSRTQTGRLLLPLA